MISFTLQLSSKQFFCHFNTLSPLESHTMVNRCVCTRYKRQPQRRFFKLQVVSSQNKCMDLNDVGLPSFLILYIQHQYGGYPWHLAMRSTSLADARSISKIFWTQPLSHNATYKRWFRIGKYHHCDQSLPRCRNTEGCRLRWNPTWNAQSLGQGSSLAGSCVPICLEGHRKIGEMGWPPTYTKRDTRWNALPRHLFCWPF